MRALVALLWIWLRNGGPFGGDSERRRLGIYNLASVLGCATTSRGISALFGLRFEIEGLEQAGPGPVVADDPAREHHRQHAAGRRWSRTSTGSACAT